MLITYYLVSHVFSLIAIVIFVQNIKSLLTWKDLKSKIKKIQKWTENFRQELTIPPHDKTRAQGS